MKEEKQKRVERGTLAIPLLTVLGWNPQARRGIFYNRQWMFIRLADLRISQI